MTTRDQSSRCTTDERKLRRARRDEKRQPHDARSLDPHDFAFHGFEESTSELEHRIRGTALRTGEPDALIVEDATFVPAVNLSQARQSTGQLSFSGGVLTADGRSVSSVHLQRGRHKLRGGLDESVAAVAEREVQEEAVYLGWLFDHFGHFLLDSLARAWFLKRVDPSVKLVFHFPPPSRRLFMEQESHLPSWAWVILKAFGVTKDRVIVPDLPTRFRRLIIPEALFMQGRTAHEAMILPFSEAASRIVHNSTLSEQPIYLSRRLLTSRRRPVVGEDELEDMLRENGFLVAHPETMAFEDQVLLVNRHKHIFSNVGSAAHNVLFALSKPALHLLTNGDRIPRNFFLCSALASAPTAFINCLGTSGRPTFDGAQSAPVLLETAKLVSYLEDRGFLKKRLRASLAGCNPALLKQYDEAWLYARIRSAATNGEILPDEVETEAVTLGLRSWPVSLMLALYYAQTRADFSRTTTMVEQFAKLADAESDMNRIVHYRSEVKIVSKIVAEVCNADIVSRLDDVQSNRFLVELARD